MRRRSPRLAVHTIIISGALLAVRLLVDDDRRNTWIVGGLSAAVYFLIGLLFIWNKREAPPKR